MASRLGPLGGDGIDASGRRPLRLFRGPDLMEDPHPDEMSTLTYGVSRDSQARSNADSPGTLIPDRDRPTVEQLDRHSRPDRVSIRRLFWPTSPQELVLWLFEGGASRTS
jgi:hypothetical protein